MLDFLLIGAQKSASTFLQNCLAEHPQLQMPKGETRVFEDPHYNEASVGEFVAPRASDGNRVKRGIKRPDYLARPEVPERVARHAPDARLIVVLRDPVPRAVSAYYHYVRLGFVPLEKPDAAFAQVLDGTMETTYPRAGEIVEFGRYGRHLQRWLGYFSRDRLLVLLQDEVVADPLTQVQLAYDFLEVDPHHVPRKLAQWSNTSVYSPWRLRLLRSRNRRRFSYTSGLERREPRRSNVFDNAWWGGVSALDRYLFARLDARPMPALRPDLTARLRGEYDEDSGLLEEIVGRPLPWG